MYLKYKYILYYVNMKFSLFAFQIINKFQESLKPYLFDAIMIGVCFIECSDMVIW